MVGPTDEYVPQFPDSRHALADDCRRCPDLAESRTCLSRGTGPLDATVVVVGEAPATGLVGHPRRNFH